MYLQTRSYPRGLLLTNLDVNEKRVKHVRVIDTFVGKFRPQRRTDLTPSRSEINVK